MIPDHLTDTVLFSDLLPARYPELWERLAAVLDTRWVPYRLLPGTRDVWTRDYMPVQVGPGEFVQFRYRPGYLRGYSHLVTGPEVSRGIPEIGTLHDSEIVLDGGNVVASRNVVIVTDRIYHENPGVPRTGLRSELERLLRCRVAVIPAERGDVIGHADGVLRFLDDRTVAVNDYSKLDPGYNRRLRSILRGAGLRTEPVPYCPVDEEYDGVPSAVGNYINFLRIGGVVVLPAHGIPEDEFACRAIKRLLPGAEVVPVRCEGLARDGGVLNCVAWTLRAADLPLDPVAGDHPTAPPHEAARA